MLPKKNRVNRKKVDELFKFGRFLSSPILNFKFVKEGEAKNIAFVAPKALSKSAVKRNLLRRRGYAALKANFSLIPQGISGIFILKSPTATLMDIQTEIKSMLSKIK